MVHAVRRRGRGQTRILYWFRTPPGVTVGRAPLDEATTHLIERHHPDIRFDWPQILRGEEESPPSLPAARPSREPLADLPRGSGARPPETAVPSRRPSTPADLDAQTLAQLRDRYSRIVALIAHRIPEPQRRAQLNTDAERLNPDAWDTPEAKQRGLDEYETVAASIRSAVGGRRRRRKPRVGNTPGSANAGSDRGPAGDDLADEPADSGGTDGAPAGEDNDESSTEAGPHE